jgi:hypothetical protein
LGVSRGGAGGAAAAAAAAAFFVLTLFAGDDEGEGEERERGFFAFFSAASEAELCLRLLGCGVEGGARLAVETLGVTRALAAAAAAAASAAAAAEGERDLRDGGKFGDAIPPFLGRARDSTGFFDSDLRVPADLARAFTGRERPVWK